MPSEEQNSQPIELTKELVIEAIKSYGGTSVDVYTDKCIHHADWTGPDEYESFDSEIYLTCEENEQGAYDLLYEIETQYASLSENYTSYAFFPKEGYSEFEKLIKDMKEGCDEDIDTTDLIGIFDNEDGDYLLVYKSTTKDEIKNYLDEVWNNTYDNVEINYEPPEPPEPDPDEYRERYDSRWDP